MSKQLNVLGNLSVGVEGFYKIEVINEKEEITHTHEQRNVITTRHINAMAAGADLNPDYGYMSTSTLEPDASYNTLPSVVASSSNRTTNDYHSGSGIDYYQNMLVSISFGVSQYIGTISAVGMGLSSGGANLISWLKLKDGLGNPTTLTLVSGDRLRLSYTIRMKMPSTQTEGVVNINGVDVTYVLFPIRTRVGWGTSLSTFNANILCTNLRPRPSQSVINYTESVTGSGNYFANGIGSSRSANGNVCDWTTVANEATWVGNIGSVDNMHWAINFTPAIPKLNTQILTITLRTTFYTI